MNLMKPLLALSLLTAAANASATDGYFAHGYGVKSQGMGGVGIALPQDAIAAASNPAGMGLIGDRMDVGMTWFRPIRESEFTAPNPTAATYNANDTKNFLIPEFGYNRQINPDVTLGVSVYGNGGMNTDYKNGVPLLNGGTSNTTGIDLIQVFVAPTVTWKLTPANTIGLAVNLAYQRFEAKGLQSFTDSSAYPNNLSDNGHDGSYGAGLHLGWVGQVNDKLSVGATYQSRTLMTKFDKYKGLFAEQGDFDIPSSYGMGLAIKASPALTLAADIQRTLYSKVDSVGNSINNLFSNNQLGTDNGPGFAWKDVTAIKLGASYAYNNALTVRAGYNHSSQPIRKNETLFNVLAPGVVQDHLTFGATWSLSDQSEISLAYMHAFENEVRGNNSIPSSAPFGGGEANLRMHQDSLGIAYGWKL